MWAPCTVLERELLELAHEALLALADLRDQRACRLRVELDPELLRAGLQPARQLAGLDGGLSTAIWPPAAVTAFTSASGTLARPSSRAKNATVMSAASIPAIAAATGATSASFQRSTPSAITNRRPIAKVMLDSALAIASGVHASPSKSSTPPTPLSASAIARRRERRSAMRPWSSPWIRYAARKLGTTADSRRAPGEAGGTGARAAAAALSPPWTGAGRPAASRIRRPR